MLFSIISILVACSGGEEAVEAPVTPAAAETTPVEAISAPAVEPCVDSTPQDPIDDCAKEDVAPATEVVTEQPTVVVVAK
jgi:hypothetical protein